MTFGNANGGRQCPLDGPPPSDNASIQCPLGNALAPRPLPQTKRFARKPQVEGSGIIPRLRRGACPPAIPRLIVPVVVNPVNAVLGRRLPAHVGQEVLEGANPPVAYLDAPTPVPAPRRLARVGATFLHGYPGVPFRAMREPMCTPICAARLRQTSAGEGGPATQMRPADDFLRTAIAPTQPTGLVPFVTASVSQHEQPTKGLPCQVLESRVCRNRMLGSHVRLPVGAPGQGRSGVTASGGPLSLYTPRANKSSEKRKVA